MMKLLQKLTGLIAMAIMISTGGYAQLSGTYTIGGGSPNYNTLGAAVSALNSQGVNGPVTFVIADGSYSGSGWQASIGNVTGASATNTITFRSQGGVPANCVISHSGTSSVNYIFELNSAKYVTIKDITLNNTGTSYGTDVRIAGSAAYNTVQNCVLTGAITTTSDATNMSRVFGTSLSTTSDMKFIGNTFTGGASAAYLYGNGTTSTGNNYVFENNVFNENHYYWLYCYYMGDITFKNNTFNRSGAAPNSYFYGLYMYATANGFLLEGNTFNNTCDAYYNYCGYFYYSNYYTQNAQAKPVFKNNTINMSNGTATYYQYVFYNLYSYYALHENNTYNIYSSYSSGYSYLMYHLYYGYYCMVKNNTYTIDRPNGGYAYTGFYYGQNDTFVNNNVNIKGNSYAYNYCPYYCQNFYVVGNNFNIRTNTLQAYGAYAYQYDGIFANNKIDVEATSGSVYGLYAYYSTGKFYNNIVTTKTSGLNYTLSTYYCYPGCKINNNTFYSYGTGSSDYLFYMYNTSTSYNAEVRNNIFARSGTNGYAAYYYNKDYIQSDYNLWSIPSGQTFVSATPSVTTASLHTWREQTGNERNSLIYNAPFTNAAGKDFSIVATSPDAWAVNGRGVHDTNNKFDIVNVARPLVPASGVPDLGAYEVTPTSTPPNAVATPANPVANSTQVFTFGQDTVMTIDWGTTVPSSYTVRQYTGLQANPMPVGVGRMFFYVTGTPATWTHSYKPKVYYKHPWIGDVSKESNAVIARSSNGGAWEGYNYTNAATDTGRNILSPAANLDSVGSYTGVENGRIGIRCVENPTGIKFTNITAFSADIDWNAIFNPVGYQVIVKDVKQTPTVLEWKNNSAFPTTNSHAAIGLKEDTKYYVYIRSVCGPKDTSGFTLDSFTTIITCHVPDVKVSDINHNRAVLSWDAIKTAYKYEWVLNNSAGAPANGTDITKTSMLLPFLDEKTTYYAHVRCHCNTIYNTSAWKTVPFTTQGLGVSSVAGTEGSLSIYPNPVQSDLHVTVKNGSKGTLAVMDMTGKVLKTALADKADNVMNISELPAGMYILRYTGEEYTEQVKFSKK